MLFLLRRLSGESFETFDADERPFAVQKPRPLEIGLLFPALRRVELTAELYPGSADLERFSAIGALTHNKEMLPGRMINVNYPSTVCL